MLVPSVHVDRTSGKTLQLYLRMVLRMESRETVVTGGTVEEHHVASDPFGLEHTQEKFATKLGVELCCSY